jgi:restriction endonuclease Mrr
MRAVGADYGYFITTSSFTDPAERWARSLKDPYIVLVDGPALIRWAQEGCLPC